MSSVTRLISNLMAQDFVVYQPNALIQPQYFDFQVIRSADSSELSCHLHGQVVVIVNNQVVKDSGCRQPAQSLGRFALSVRMSLLVSNRDIKQLNVHATYISN